MELGANEGVPGNFIYTGDDSLEELRKLSVVHVLRFDGGLVGVVFARGLFGRAAGFVVCPGQETCCCGIGGGGGGGGGGNASIV